ncbi:MAG TPA: hypothetical protein VN885_02530 [Candidatus Acidoferrales bacterium]|nr:hypothetical protein [Candidatus Acidoferrales bacterium]
MGGELGAALCEGVQTGSQKNVLRDAAYGLFDDQIHDEAGAGYDGGAEEGGAARIHVRTVAPAFVRSHEFETDFVFEHVRRQIYLDVEGPREGYSHCGIVRSCVSVVRHGVLPPRDDNCQAGNCARVLL